LSAAEVNSNCFVVEKSVRQFLVEHHIKHSDSNLHRPSNSNSLPNNNSLLNSNSNSNSLPNNKQLKALLSNASFDVSLPIRE
jgi:hypothetical protein